MEKSSKPCGWQLHHREHLIFRANVGAPTIRLKFFHYPAYRQTVHIDQPPIDCKLKVKGNNAFFLFQQKIRTKGMISLERVISVFPILFSVKSQESWGMISDVPRLLQRKYKQSFTYWPVSSPVIRDVSLEPWFSTNDLSVWVHAANNYIIGKIKHPEPQGKRLGAENAFQTGVGDCDEFTDLFITLARIRGIPCRRLTGFFISLQKNEPEPHAWSEILSPALGWVPIDVALHNLGNHTANYVIVKIEEFNPSLLDYQVQKQSSAVHYQWERPEPIVTPIYETNPKEKTF